MEAEHQRELCQVLADHAKRYPLMAPCDAVKLIFQNEFGGEHLICEPSATLAWLRAERASTPDDPSAPRWRKSATAWCGWPWPRWNLPTARCGP